MKKLITMLLVLAVCLAVACPVFAAEDDFVPSITYKPMPELTGEPADDGCENIGYVYDDEGEILAGVHYADNGEVYVDGVHEGDVEDGHECLIITPLAEAETDPEIPEESRERLLWVYEQIMTQGMDFFDDCEELANAITAALGEGAAINDLVVKDLFDVTVICDELEEYLEPEDTTICLDFDLGLEPGTFVAVVAYKGGQWRMIEDVEVLEDGSVACTTYENFCPVAVLVPVDEVPAADLMDAPHTGDSIGTQTIVWSVIAALSLAAIVALVLVQRKRKAEN